jgi:hypothetical protein
MAGVCQNYKSTFSKEKTLYGVAGIGDINISDFLQEL